MAEWVRLPMKEAATLVLIRRRNGETIIINHNPIFSVMAERILKDSDGE